MVQKRSGVLVKARIYSCNLIVFCLKKLLPMNQQTFYAILFLGIFLLLVGMAHALYKLFGISTENSRKFLHVSGGFLSLCSPLFFTNHLWVLLLCSLAFVLLLITYFKHWLPSIHQTQRKSIGSVIYPVSVYFCFLVAAQKNNFLLFYLPISLLTVSDTIAEIVGKKWGVNSRKIMYSQKTFAGSISFAISALVISTGWGLLSNLAFLQIISVSVIITVIATVAEMVSTRGWDNITVPLITLASLLIVLKV